MEPTGEEQGTFLYDDVKLWIRVDTAIRSDPNVAELAARLKIGVAQAAGHCLLFWAAVAEHCPDGDISRLSKGGIGRMAAYERAPHRASQAFADVFLELFTSNGHIRGWADRQGKLIERAEKDRARKFHGSSAEMRGVSTVTERNGTEQITTTTKATTGNPPKVSPFPMSISDELYDTWISKRGAVDYAVFRKALSPLFPAKGQLYPVQALVAAITCFADVAESQTPKESGFWTVHKFALDAGRWVRLGAMPLQLPDSTLTERGRLVAGLQA
jgi:hypothetical protein